MKFLPYMILIIMGVPIVLGVIATGSSSSYTFYVENCTSPQISEILNCSPANIRFQCDISPSAFINNVAYRIDGADYNTQQNYSNPNQFYINYNKPQEISSNYNPLTLDREQITDVDNKKLNAYLIVQINRSCTTCPATYITNPITSCQINDTYTLEHISSNESCAPSYNSTETCNYCSPNILQNATICDTNGTQTVSYTDTNYSTCCLTTGLPSDCIINDPIYDTKNQSCNYYINQFSCTGDSKPVINNKINLNCELPDEQEYCCVVNIYQGANLTDLLASTPEYTNKGASAIFPQEQETRTCFTPNNRLLNGYYTEKELRPDTSYKVEVKCTANATTLITQYEIIPQYKTWDWFTHRIAWFGNNPIQITLTFVAIIIIILVGIYFIKKAA